MTNIVGNNIRRLRLQAGMTQEDLALQSGLSQGYVNQLESGKRRFTQKSLELIAKAMSMSIGEFFKGGEISKIPMLAKKIKKHEKKHIDREEFLALLKELPQHIAEHYLTLMKLEMKIIKKQPQK